MLEILEIVIKSAAFSILLLLCWNDAYRAGRNDERDKQIQSRQHGGSGSAAATGGKTGIVSYVRIERWEP